jgi:hypothetical protein
LHRGAAARRTFQLSADRHQNYTPTFIPKADFVGGPGMSARCQKRTFHHPFIQLARRREQAALAELSG